MLSELGNLQSVPVRSIWPNEAHDFTPWLADHLPLLAEALELTNGIELKQREAAVGNFSLDLLAQEVGGNERKIIIENQFGNTDHDHLGKLLTYAAGTDANLIVWITEALRDEHREALEWLNRHTDEKTQFFAITVEAIRIDESRPAVRFNVEVQPNEWQRQTRYIGNRPGNSEREERYRGFFQRLLDELRTEHSFTKARLAQPQSWYSFSSGISNISYEASFAQQGRVKAALYLGRSDTGQNKEIFDNLRADAKEIESEFGAPLEWERLDHRVASRIACTCNGSIDDSEEALQQLHAWFICTLLKLRQVFEKRLPSAISNINNTQ